MFLACFRSFHRLVLATESAPGKLQNTPKRTGMHQKHQNAPDLAYIDVAPVIENDGNYALFPALGPRVSPFFGHNVGLRMDLSHLFSGNRVFVGPPPPSG